MDLSQPWGPGFINLERGVSEARKNALKVHDFPLELQEIAQSSTGDSVDENISILHQSLDDVHKNFFSSGQKLVLPQTALLSISDAIKFPEEIING